MDSGAAEDGGGEVEEIEVPAYNHGFIVESAAEKRLTLASTAVNGGPVWLVRRASAVEPGGPEETILSTLVNYQDGVDVTHYRICRNTKNHRYYLVQSDGGRADNDYDSIDQLLTAYKIPEGMPSPAPLGIFVPRDATEIWTGKKKEESTDRRLSSPSAQESRFAYKCQLCGLFEGTVEPFVEHVLQHTAEERALSSFLRMKTGSHSLHASGVHVLVSSAAGPLVCGGTDECFVRVYHAGTQFFQSAAIRGAGARPQWDEPTFVPVKAHGTAMQQPIRVELCVRNSTGVETATGIGEVALQTLEFNEPKEIDLVMHSLVATTGTASSVGGDDTTISLVFVMSRRDLQPAWKPTPVTWQPDDGIWRQLTPRFRQFRAQKKKRDAMMLPAQIMTRLGKLLYEFTPGGDRKAFEKSVVEWVKDTLVKKCPDCGEGFGFSRRRHHCRLCGGVVCGGCSVTLDIPEAAEMVKEVAHVKKDSQYDAAPVTCEVAVRSCSNCVRVAERAHGAAMQLAQFKTHRSSAREQMTQVTSYYQVLMDGKEHLRVDSELYCELAVRLSRHEGIDCYPQVGELYKKMVEEISVIDKVSKKIISFSTGMDFLVFESVRELCVIAVGRVINQLPSIPTETVLNVAAKEQTQRRVVGAAALAAAGGKLFELWEVQRWHPTLWFSSSVLGETDWQSWSSADGSWGYFSRDAVNPPTGSAWNGGWFQHFTDGDSDGWQYASTFDKNRESWSSVYDRTEHCVRRRRWYRTHNTRRSMNLPATSPAPPGGRRSDKLPRNASTPLADSAAIDGTEAWRRADIASGSPAPLGDSQMTDSEQADYSDGSEEDDEDADHKFGGKAAWIKDSATKQCMLCTVGFTKRRRRHHCRHCGRVVCSKCSGHLAPHPEYKKKKRVRMCDQCHEFQKTESVALS